MVLSRSRGQGFAYRGWPRTTKAVLSFSLAGVEKGECRRAGESDSDADGIVRATRGVFELGGQRTGTSRRKKERATDVSPTMMQSTTTIAIASSGSQEMVR